MPTPSLPQLSIRNHAPVPDETTLMGLTGRYLQISHNPVAPSTPAGLSYGGMVHAVEIDAGQAVGYRNRWVNTDPIATHVMSFGGRTLALAPGALPCELDEHLGILGRIDFAGHGRGVGAHPRIDPHAGALHFVSYGDEPAHHIVAPNSQTRITVPVPDAPGPLQDLLVTPDHFVLLGAGFTGVTDRTRHARARWADVDLSGSVAASDLSGDVVVLTANRSLVRWTFDAGSPRRDVLDDTPQRFGTTNPRVSEPTHVWTVAAAGGTEVYRHDLRTGDRTAHDLGVGRHPGAMTFVPDPTRLHREDGGWLLGFAHDDMRNETDLVVLDATAIHRPPVASVRIPRRIPHGLHGTWIPTT